MPLLETLARWRPFSALVVGDLILDELVFGNADRLSPDAPVPVLHVQKSEHRPGGAANVCLDLLAMRGSVQAIGVVGDDPEGIRLGSAMTAAGVEMGGGGVVDPARPTTVKRSLIGLAQHRHPQKMFRVDYESRAPISAEVLARVIAAFDAALPSADVVCIEDYDKGVCTPELCAHIIQAARAKKVPVLVDPAAISDYAKYRGCSAITPNRTEASRATAIKVGDDAEPEAHAPIAEKLVRELDLEAAVITLDRHGALLLERGGASTHLPTQAREVYDVTGAGDMVLAALAAGRANGLSWPDAVRMANAAAGLEVEVFGVVPMPIERIHREVMDLEHGGRGMGGKVRTLDQLLVDLAAFRAEAGGDRSHGNIVFTNGCFDILHAGHTSLLKRAKALAVSETRGNHGAKSGGSKAAGGMLIVAVNSDDSVKRLKGPQRPINSVAVRADLLADLEYVDAVVVFEEDTPERLIRAIRPDVLVKGGEYLVDQVPGAKFVQETGGRVELLPMVAGHSTTGTIARIRTK